MPLHQTYNDKKQVTYKGNKTNDTPSPRTFTINTGNKNLQNKDKNLNLSQTNTVIVKSNYEKIKNNVGSQTDKCL